MAGQNGKRYQVTERVLTLFPKCRRGLSDTEAKELVPDLTPDETMALRQLRGNIEALPNPRGVNDADWFVEGKLRPEVRERLLTRLELEAGAEERLALVIPGLDGVTRSYVADGLKKTALAPSRADLRLETLAEDAVRFLQGIAADGEAPVAARVKAAQAILDFTLRMQDRNDRMLRNEIRKEGRS